MANLPEARHVASNRSISIHFACHVSLNVPIFTLPISNVFVSNELPYSPSNTRLNPMKTKRQDDNQLMRTGPCHAVECNGFFVRGFLEMKGFQASGDGDEELQSWRQRASGVWWVMMSFAVGWGSRHLVVFHQIGPLLYDRLGFLNP